MGAEAEGSGLGWGSDVGSGSGDPVGSEELLRVSVKDEKAWCPGWPSQQSGRDRLTGGHQMKPDWPPSVIVKADGGFWEFIILLPLHLYVFVYVFHIHQFCFVLNEYDPKFIFRTFTSPLASFPWQPSPSGVLMTCTSTN